jgi:hypothetical protein
LPVAAAFWQAFRPVGVAAMLGAEAMGTTDAPTELFERDRLQFGPLARGNSRFLRDTRTELAIGRRQTRSWPCSTVCCRACACTAWGRR